MDIFRYATVEDVERYLDIDSPSPSATRREINSFISRSSAAIDSFTKRRFSPRRDTLVFDYNKSDSLDFKEDVLAVKGLSDYNGASEFDSGVYYLRQGDTYNRQPYDNLVVKEDTGSSLNYSGTTLKAIHADVIIGFSSSYSGAWQEISGSTVEDVTANATDINIGASSEYNDLYFRNKVNTGDLLKIDDEFIYVRSGSDAANITVVRGLNGTTAASHASGTTIFTWKPEEDIHYSTIGLAAWQYVKKESPYQNRVASLQFGTIEMPETWPSEILDKIKNYKRHRVVSI